MMKFVIIWITFFCLLWKACAQDPDCITIAILAKDKAHTLPLYLSCIEQQTWPKAKTFLYIRTNNNNDHTAQILRDWIQKVEGFYAGIYFEDKDLPERLQDYKQHEWNAVRFKALGKIRQESIDFAKAHCSHYFVVDCDNFIKPDTLEKMAQAHLPIIAPLLTEGGSSYYANYHAAIDNNGYYAHSNFYEPILFRQIKGIIELPLVHCTYFIAYDVLDQISYDDDSYRYEYVIFSDQARKKNIAQYLDNRELYGRITFAQTSEDLAKESWIEEFLPANHIEPVGKNDDFLTSREGYDRLDLSQPPWNFKGKKMFIFPLDFNKNEYISKQLEESRFPLLESLHDRPSLGL